MTESAKKGWLITDWVNETSLVLGSVSQCQAPTAVEIDTTASKTEKKKNETIRVERGPCKK